MPVVQTTFKHTRISASTPPSPPPPPPLTQTITATLRNVAWAIFHEVFLNLEPVTFLNVLDEVSPSRDRFQRGKKDFKNFRRCTIVVIPAMAKETGGVTCDDINSGGAAVLWPWGETLEGAPVGRGRRGESRVRKGGVTLSSFG